MAPQDLQHVVHFFLIVSITYYIYIGMILMLDIPLYIYPNPQRTSKWRPFKRTSKWSKGPQRTSKDLRGPQGTSGDLRGPPMWTWDHLRPFRLEIEGTMHKIIDWNDNDIQDRTISFKMIAWHENIIEDLYDGLKHPSAKWAHEQCLNSPLKESRA